MNKFKDYIYLNINFLESFYAQIDRGLNLIQLMENIRERETEDGVAKTIEISSNPFVKETTSHPVSTRNANLTKKSIMLKQHDNMLDRFIAVNKIKEINTLYEENLGAYVALKTHYDFVNLDRIEKLMDLKLEVFYDRISLKQRNKEYIAKIRENINVIKVLIPFRTFLCSNQTIVLIDDDNMREFNEQVGYKFNNEATVVGRVNKKTNILRENSAELFQLMDDIQSSAINLLQELGFFKNRGCEMYLITPIAIYV